MEVHTTAPLEAMVKQINAMTKKLEKLEAVALSKLVMWVISLGRPIMIPIQTHSILIGRIIRISVGEEIKDKESTTTFTIKIVLINHRFRESSLINSLIYHLSQFRSKANLVLLKLL
ncbi:hypothetical protein PIB30_098745 [Stylosanthes scabra]|uniref:Uncharacterized protein n=1 Tax=Stylosanthes scabra TaxID=79078 RepID=A0ABU6RWJ7_9FABA|nr:hypothetical protein [Stylosanthes scabra]